VRTQKQTITAHLGYPSNRYGHILTPTNKRSLKNDISDACETAHRPYVVLQNASTQGQNSTCICPQKDYRSIRFERRYQRMTRQSALGPSSIYCRQSPTAIDLNIIAKYQSNRHILSCVATTRYRAETERRRRLRHHRASRTLFSLSLRCI
jgi:hypothetical protein